MSKIDFKPFPFILLRTPLQSYLHSYQFPEAEYPSLFMEGVYLSSPDFWNEFQKTGFQKNSKIEETLNKYWLRSCTRATPYGTFAGCSLVTVGQEETKLVVGDSNKHRKYIRLDTKYVSKIIEAITSRFSLVDEIKFFSNNSLYNFHGKLRYVEYQIANDNKKYQLSAVEATPYLIAVLAKALHGATVKELVAHIQELEDVEEDEAREFILNLIQEKLLVSELEPCVTGTEPFDQLINKLSAFEKTKKIQQYLQRIGHNLKNPGTGVDFYKNIEADLQKLFLGDENAAAHFPKQAFQLDLFPEMEKNVIEDEVLQEIVAQISDLMLLSRPRTNMELENFKQLFNSKYNNEEVPLAIALDTDLGIGYAGVKSGVSGFDELIENLPEYENRKTESYEIDYIVRYVVDKYQQMLKNDLSQIEITEEDLRMLTSKNPAPSYPNSMHIMGNLFGKNGNVNKDDFLFALYSVEGPSGGRLLGRFAHGCEKIHQSVQEILSHEESQDPNVIFAEIVHLPQAKVGNILLRPTLRKYEIPYVGNSGVAREDQIPIDDLVVRIVNNKVILISKKHNKQVVPRLTVAHNFVVSNLPVYKFLCDLQFQGFSSPVMWDWGLFGTLNHLPRVVYKNIVVKKAWWKIEERQLVDIPKDKVERIAFLRKYCVAIGIPSRVVYREGDNALLIDLNEDKGAALLLYYLGRKKNILVEESLIDESNFVVVDSKKNPYANEIIIPIYSSASSNTNKAISKKNTETGINFKNDKVKKNFALYSEWLFFKIYCGGKTAETLLRSVITPFIEKGVEQQLFERFFFIRYREKEESPHLRFRFYNADLDKQLIVQKEFSLLLEPYLEAGMIEKICLDTYSRELERYGGDLITEAEDLFYNDSLAILRFISLLEEEDGQYRMLFAMRGIDILLNDFKFDLEKKLTLIRKIQQSFFSEYGGQISLQKQLNDRYRKYQRFIFSHMDENNDQQNEIMEAVAIFNERSSMNAQVIDRILAKVSEMPEGTLFGLLPSYIHMFMNKLFIAKQRKYELVIYHFLERFYTSQSAIRKK